ISSKLNFAFCQLVEFSPDLYIDCLIAAANPDPDSAGVDVGCPNGISRMSNASASFIIGSPYCYCAPFPPQVRRRILRQYLLTAPGYRPGARTPPSVGSHSLWRVYPEYGSGDPKMERTASGSEVE